MPPTPPRELSFDEIVKIHADDPGVLRTQARVVLSEAFLPEAYRRLKDPDVTTTSVVEIAKVLVDLGDMKPKQPTTPTQSGPIASIQIVFPSPAGEPPQVLEATATPADQAGPPLEDGSSEPSGTGEAPPVNFNGPGMDFNIDLGAGVPVIASPSGGVDETG
jgi:hypothetical protein